MINNLKCSVIGIGRLGLCFSLTLEKAGYHVVGYDINEPYIKSINNKTFNSFEPGVNNRIKESKNFTVTTDPVDILQTSMAFVTVRTDSKLRYGRRTPPAAKLESELQPGNHSTRNYSTQPNKSRLRLYWRRRRLFG